MSQDLKPKLYLISPATFLPDAFLPKLAQIVERLDIACVRLAISPLPEDEIIRLGDAVRQFAHDNDLAVVLDEHYLLAERLGFDGVHLLDGARHVKAARKALGKEAIIGAFCGGSRHDGMNAGELGADYVAFGPVGPNHRGDGSQTPLELFEWWSEMIELPVVAEGSLRHTEIELLAKATDFFAIGPEIWSSEDPLGTLETLLGPHAPERA